MAKTNYVITKWCKSITDSHKDEYTGRPHSDLPHKFRLLDDDGVVYAYGYSDNDSSFAPLNHYAGAYGCTMIEYKNLETGTYEQL